jgi:hypothetical protein
LGDFQLAVPASGLAPLFLWFSRTFSFYELTRVMALNAIIAGLDACIGRKTFLFMSRDPALV